MALTFIVPGLDEAASEKIIGILQNRLSQEQEASLVLKHAHWNVTCLLYTSPSPRDCS